MTYGLFGVFGFANQQALDSKIAGGNVTVVGGLA